MAANFEVVELPEDEQDVWDKLHLSSEQATIFSSSDFSRILHRASGQKYRYLVCFRGEKPIAGLPVYTTSRAGVRIAQQPPLVPHLGLILSGSLGKEHPRTAESKVMSTVKALSDWLAGRFDSISLSHHPSLRDIRPFTWQGYSAAIRYTYRIKLDGFGMDALHSSVRKQVAKGEREGLIIERSQDTAPLLSLVRMSYGKRGRGVPFADRYLEILFDELSLLKRASLWYVRDREGRLLSGRMLIESGEVVYDWVAGADPSLYESGATSFLLYHLIENSRKSHTVFDLMGANTPSIAVFKSNFGGLITPYHLTTKTISFKGAFALFCRSLLGRWRKS
jgi:hypothetical protein